MKDLVLVLVLVLVLINFSIVYCYLFTPLMNKHVSLIKNIDEIKELPNISNDFITNKYYSSNIFKKIRLTKLQTDNKQIFSSIFIPYINYSAPILTVDAIRYSSTFSTILINVYTNNSTYIDNLSEIKYEYLEYYYNIKTNINNYRKITNKSSLYSIYNDNQINKYCEIFEVYLTSYLKMFEFNPEKLEENDNFQMTFKNNKRKIDLMEYKGCFNDEFLSKLLTENYLDINF